MAEREPPPVSEPATTDAYQVLARALTPPLRFASQAGYPVFNFFSMRFYFRQACGYNINQRFILRFHYPKWMFGRWA